MKFWEEKELEEMTAREWESLCDGCGKCCLIKLEEADSGEVYYTDVACELFNTQTCRCQDYPNRKQKIPDCMQLSPDIVKTYPWLPSTCTYRLLGEGKPLPSWHPLISGTQETVHTEGVSVQGRVLSAEWIHPEQYEERIIHWVLD